jgi:hypothetical protein
LNELAAALGDDANFATTVTNEIATKVSKSGDTMSGVLAMGTNKITGVGDPTSNQDAATKKYVDDQDALKLSLTGGTMSGAVAMGNNKITGLATPTDNADATTKLYVDGILGSATSAATSAAAAAVSASNAATSASNASTSESNALSSANAAAASYDSFDDRYLGSKTSNPSVDNDGNALLTGALYFNSTAGEMRVWSGSAWTAAYLPSSAYITYVAPSTSGNVLTSNGTDWTSAPPAATLSGVTNSTSPFETSLGFEAGLNTTGENNTFTGYQAGKSNTTGTNNTAIGYRAGYLITTGNYNTAVGSSAGDALTTGGLNTAIGWGAAGSTTTGIRNSFLGAICGVNVTTGNYNVGVGAYAITGNLMGTSDSERCVAIGYEALSNLQLGDRNVAIGAGSLSAGMGSTPVDGNDNVAIGDTSGDRITTGNQNVLVGSGAGSSGTNDLTTGSNNIIIGYNAAASSATVSNEVTIGNTSITSTRLRGMVELNAAMFEAATISATAATGTINFDARTQSVLYYTSNASGNWTLNIRAASGVSLDSVMSTGESMTVAFLVTNGATAYYQTGFQVDGTSVTPKPLLLVTQARLTPTSSLLSRLVRLRSRSWLHKLNSHKGNNHGQPNT